MAKPTSLPAPFCGIQCRTILNLRRISQLPKITAYFLRNTNEETSLHRPHTRAIREEDDCALALDQSDGRECYLCWTPLPKNATPLHRAPETDFLDRKRIRHENFTSNITE